MRAKDVVRLITGHAFRVTTEAELQACIANVLENALCPHLREHILSRQERIDFFLPEHAVGIEVKIDGSLTTILRQLHRYAQFDEIHSLVLVTTRMAHNRVPSKMNKKPIHLALLRGAFT